MTSDRFTAGGGCLILLGFLVGAFLGIRIGQPSFGVLIGVGVGAVLAVLLWLYTRRGSDEVPPSP